MKKLAIVVVLALFLAAIPASVFAQEVKWEGHFKPGNLSLSVGVGLGYGYWGWGFSAYPGVEFTLIEWKVANVVPLAFGVAARGLVGFSPYYGLGFGAGAFGTVHLGFKGLDIPSFLQKFDVYTGIGIVFNSSSYYTGGFGLGFSSMGGFNYFLSDNFAIIVEESYWAYYAGTTIGVLLKL